MAGETQTAGIRFELTGAEAALAKLGAALARTEKPKSLFDAIGASLVVSTQMRFERESGPDGSPWPKSLRAALEGGRTLTDTGQLFRSITHEPSDRSVAVGSNMIYAAIHQTGGTIRAKDGGALAFRLPGNGAYVNVSSVEIPARPFLGLDADDEAEITAIAGDWLRESLEGGADAGR